MNVSNETFKIDEAKIDRITVRNSTIIVGNSNTSPSAIDRTEQKTAKI